MTIVSESKHVQVFKINTKLNKMKHMSFRLYPIGLEKKARGSKLGSGSVRLGSARSGSRAWNEPSRASFLGSLKRRAEPSRLAS